MSSERPPYGSYAAIVSVFMTGLAGAGGLARALGRNSDELAALDLIALSAATFKVARTISHDRVASFVRQPFVEGEAGVQEEERPAGEGMQRALGELVTCSRCIGTWTAAGLASAQLLTPRFGKLVTWSLGAAAANDFLQAGFAALCARVNRLEGDESRV